MGYDTDSIRQNLITWFGDSLKHDAQFHVNSPETYSYNCIAWAMGMDDRWVDHHETIPWHWWPSGVQRNLSRQALVDAFIALGFEEATNPEFEAGYDKVALYAKGNEWSHAAKIIDDIRYHSKFGASNDAFHSGGDTLMQGYGSIFTYMRRKCEDAHITDDIKGSNFGEIYLNVFYRGYPIVYFKGQLHDYGGHVLVNKGSYVYTESGNKLKLVGNELVEVTK